MSLLEVEDIETSYGASQALFGVSFSIDEGEVCALMGRNGMGKSTTVKTICRMLPLQNGNVRFAGQDLTALQSHRVAQLGIGLVPEGRRCFSNLNVAENLTAAARHGLWNVRRVTELFPKLADRLEQSAGSLSGGEQQMLAIGRALMTNPKLLILDEATEGLAPLVRAEIWNALHYLRKETGIAILLIDKSIKEISSVSQNVTILQRGRSVWTGKFSDLDNETTNRYIGI
ncbi:MAG: ABC transporter ATP-binding protein [Pseudomonadota bacterium]